MFNTNWNHTVVFHATLTWFLKESFYYFDKFWNYIRPYDTKRICFRSLFLTEIKTPNKTENIILPPDRCEEVRKSGCVCVCMSSDGWLSQISLYLVYVIWILLCTAPMKEYGSTLNRVNCSYLINAYLITSKHIDIVNWIFLADGVGSQMWNNNNNGNNDNNNDNNNSTPKDLYTRRKKSKKASNKRSHSHTLGARVCVQNKKSRFPSTHSRSFTRANLYSWCWVGWASIRNAEINVYLVCVCRMKKPITYIVIPGHFVWFRVRSYGAFKINAIAFFNIIRVKWRSHFQRYHWHIW